MFLPVALFAVIVATVYLSINWVRRQYSFWKDRGVLTPPISYVWGNYREIALQKKCFSEQLHEFYDYFKSKGVPHGGVYTFTSPVYIPVDIDIVKSILQTDFDHFAERGIYTNQEDDPLSANLFTLDEHKWKPLRTQFSPAFSSAKLRMMYDLLVQCATDLEVELDKFDGKSLDMKELIGRYTINVIGSSAFGVECNCFKEPNNDFRKNGSSFFHHTTLETLKVVLTDFAPNLMKKFHVIISKPSAIEFFKHLVKDTMDYREKNNIIRKDFMHLLIQLKNSGKVAETEEAGNMEKIAHDNEYLSKISLAKRMCSL
uniref:Cytochrome P450 6BQ22 n=1 Tax=Propylea japonica TaxID=158624 RepID=A0A9E7V378_9CUCU|nr:cytochrome P450 6BQ22 [Propylea japonica]